MIPFPDFSIASCPLFLCRETKHIVIWNVVSMKLTKLCGVNSKSSIIGESKMCFINKHETTGEHQFITHKDSSKIVKIIIP